MQSRFLRRFTAIVLALFIAGFAFGIETSDLNRVTFKNDTGYDILYLFFSPGDSDLWGADILGTTRTLDDGEIISFYIYYPDAANEFDFLAIDVDGDAYLIWDYTISDKREEQIVITLADLANDGWDLDLAEVNLTNDTGYEIWYLFFSPGDSRMWGVDMLDDETILYDGDVLSLYVPVTDELARFDFLGKDEDDDEYEFYEELSNDDYEYDFVIEFSDIVGY